MGKRRRHWRNFWECPECPEPEPHPEPESNTWCYFSSDPGSQIQQVIGFIERCEPGTKICFTAYSFTIRALAHALIDARDRGCDVKIIVDSKRSSSQAKCIVNMLRLASKECTVDSSILGSLEIKQDRVYCRNEDGTPKLKLDSHGNAIMENNGSAEIEYETGGSALMHNKYIVEFIEEDRGAVFTGSFNYSDSAETNEENILITRDASAVKKYFENFMYLWNKSDEYDYIPAEYLYPLTTPPIEAPVVKKVWRKNEYEIVDCNDFDLWDNQWPNRTSFGDQ